MSGTKEFIFGARKILGIPILLSGISLRNFIMPLDFEERKTFVMTKSSQNYVIGVFAKLNKLSFLE